MDAKKDQLLIERLSEGVEVNNLFPNKYYNGNVFYEVHIYSKEIKVVLVMKTSGTVVTYLKIEGVFAVGHVEKEPLTSSLIGKTVIFERSKVYPKAERNNFCLVGKLYLQNEEETL